MRRGHRRLVAVLAAAAIALTAAAATAQATQAAEPLDWTVAAGFPVEFNDATVILETTIVPAADAHTLEPYPIQRINIVNDSNDTRYFSFGIDIETQSVIEPMWEPETFGESEPDPHNPFVVRLSPGEARRRHSRRTPLLRHDHRSSGSARSTRAARRSSTSSATTL